MKKILSALIIAALTVSLATGADDSAKSTPIPINLPNTDRLPGVDLAEGITQITGTAISPLLGVSSAGAWRYYRTPSGQRGSLPWFCHPGVWGFGFVILGACFLKDVIGTVAPPLLKKPLDMAELFESKLSALVASVAFVPFIAVQMAEHFDTAQAHLSPSIDLHYASVIPIATVGFDLRMLFIPLGIVAFLVVWMAGHAINVLIALSPIGFVDTLLKVFKLSILGLVAFSYVINPYLGAAISLLIVLVAALLAPAAFRLTVFGSMFATDTIMPRRAGRLATPAEAHGFMARSFTRIPTRTYGRVARSKDGTICFSYRPWLILPRRTVQLPGTLAISRGIYHPSLLDIPGPEITAKRIIIFPPRYRNHEPAIAGHLGISDMRDSTLAKGFKATKTWLAETLQSGKSRFAALYNGRGA